MMDGNDPRTGMPPSFEVHAPVSSYEREDWAPVSEESVHYGAEFSTQILEERRALMTLNEELEVGFHYSQRFPGV